MVTQLPPAKTSENASMLRLEISHRKAKKMRLQLEAIITLTLIWVWALSSPALLITPA